jgi:rhomboid protease GluP
VYRPPLTELPRFPVTGGTALLAVGATLAYVSDAALVSPFMADAHVLVGEYWRLLTCILVHVNLLHLFFDVSCLWVFGTLLEKTFGHPAALGMIVLLAAGSGAAEYAVLRGGVGLSGVGYGFFTLIWVLSRTDPRFRGAVDRNTINLLVTWFFLCIAVDLLGIMPVGNIAHGVGAGLGALLGVAIGVPRRRVAAALGLSVSAAACLAAAIWFRPWINFSRDRGQDEAYVGYTRLEDGRNDDAERLYRAAVVMRPDKGDYWTNLGIAQARVGRVEESQASFAKAAALRGEVP